MKQYIEDVKMFPSKGMQCSMLIKKVNEWDKLKKPCSMLKVNLLTTIFDLMKDSLPSYEDIFESIKNIVTSCLFCTYNEYQTGETHKVPYFCIANYFAHKVFI